MTDTLGSSHGVTFLPFQHGATVAHEQSARVSIRAVRVVGQCDAAAGRRLRGGGSENPLAIAGSAAGSRRLLRQGQPVPQASEHSQRIESQQE